MSTHSICFHGEKKNLDPVPIWVYGKTEAVRLFVYLSYDPCHVKSVFGHIWTVKAQISLHISLIRVFTVHYQSFPNKECIESKDSNDSLLMCRRI